VTRTKVLRATTCATFLAGSEPPDPILPKQPADRKLSDPDVAWRLEGFAAVQPDGGARVHLFWSWVAP
jgi:hypothetical protein